MRGGCAIALLALCALCSRALSTQVFLKETFDDTWKQRWHVSRWKQAENQAGAFNLTAGKWYGDEVEDRGIQTFPDYRYFALYHKMAESIDTLDKELVVQFSIKNEQKLYAECAGAYMKILPGSSKTMMKDFGSQTPYSIMFGPDICSATNNKVHVILQYKGKNHELKRERSIKAKTDRLTHVYTLVIRPDSTYEVLVDLESVQKGSLDADLGMLGNKTIKDPKAKKPKKWDEREFIPDKTHKKPKGWDDIMPTMPDPEAIKPHDWDDKAYGPWDPPEVPNPAYRGPWVRRQIKNPNYKGPWVAPEIPNPDYVFDPELYRFRDLRYVGFELWQVKAGSLFDNVLITDDLEAAKQLALDTWGKSKAKEKEMFEEYEVQERAAEAAAEAERAAREAEETAREARLDKARIEAWRQYKAEQEQQQKSEL